MNNMSIYTEKQKKLLEESRKMNCLEVRKILQEPVNISKPTTKQTEAVYHLLVCNECFGWSYKLFERAKKMEQ